MTISVVSGGAGGLIDKSSLDNDGRFCDCGFCLCAAESWAAADPMHITNIMIAVNASEHRISRLGIGFPSDSMQTRQSVERGGNRQDHNGPTIQQLGVVYNSFFPRGLTDLVLECLKPVNSCFGLFGAGEMVVWVITYRIAAAPLGSDQP